MNWKYKGEDMVAIPEGNMGFIYLITNMANGKIYIGKKFFNFTRRKLLTKKDKLLPENKRKKYKTVILDGKWENYFSSSASLLADIEIYGKENFAREIICFCRDKRELTYKEVWWQFNYNVLEVPSYNENILGRFFKSKSNV